MTRQAREGAPDWDSRGERRGRVRSGHMDDPRVQRLDPEFEAIADELFTAAGGDPTLAKMRVKKAGAIYKQGSRLFKKLAARYKAHEATGGDPRSIEKMIAELEAIWFPSALGPARDELIAALRNLHGHIEEYQSLVRQHGRRKLKDLTDRR